MMDRFPKRRLAVLLMSLFLLFPLAACEGGLAQPPQPELTGREPSAPSSEEGVRSPDEGPYTSETAENAGTESHSEGAAAADPSGQTQAVTSVDPVSPHDAHPSEGGRSASPSAAIDPRLINSGSGKPISTAALTASGGIVTVETHTTSDTPAPGGNSQPLNSSIPLLDGVECLFNELTGYTPEAEEVRILSTAGQASEAGLNNAAYTEDYFRNYCLIVADVQAEGRLVSTRALSLTEENGSLSLLLRLERSGTSGVTGRRYLVEIPKRYAGWKVSVQKQYANVNAAYNRSEPVSMRLSFSYPFYYESLGTTFENNYAVPSLTAGTNTARAINDDIERTVYDRFGSLIRSYAGGEAGRPTSVLYDYGYTPATGAVCILLSMRFVDSGEPEICFFYYNARTDTRLTLEQYLALQGLSASGLSDELAGGYRLQVPADKIAGVCVHAARAYKVFVRGSSGRIEPYDLPILEQDGLRYLFHAAGGIYQEVGIQAESGRGFAFDGLNTTTEPMLLPSADRALAVIGVSRSVGDTFMVLDLKDGKVLSLPEADPAVLAGWFGPAPASFVALCPKAVTGDASSYGVSLELYVQSDATYTAPMYYDGRTLVHVTEDGKSVGGDWTHTASDGGLRFTNGTVTRTAELDGGGPYTVSYSGDRHYAVITYGTGTEEPVPHTLTVFDLAAGRTVAIPALTAEELLKRADKPDGGYVGASCEFTGWQSVCTFGVTVTLYDGSGSAETALTLPLTVSLGVNGAAVG